MDDNSNFLLMKRIWLWLTVAAVVLTAAAAFAAGYLYRDRYNHAPIIIEKCGE